MATYGVPATHTVSSSMCCKRGMQLEAWGQMQDGSWVGGDTCRIAGFALKGFWWGSAPQMLLVQQPEWLSGGCKAMGPEAWTHPRGRERAMPWQLTSWAVQPARSDGELNSNFVISELAVVRND